MSGFTIGDPFVLAPASIAIGLTLAWLAGVRVYLTVFAIGLAGALGFALPAALHVLASPWVIGSCALLAAIDCVADKIPGFDSGWSLLHTLVRVPVGAFLAAAAVSRDGRLGGDTLLVGGAVALGSPAIKSATRQLLNASPEPLSNWSASLAEDILTLTSLALLLVSAWAALAVAVGGLLLGAPVVLWSFRAVLRVPFRKTQAAA
jgi:hypothetical protein